MIPITRKNEHVFKLLINNKDFKKRVVEFKKNINEIDAREFISSLIKDFNLTEQFRGTLMQHLDLTESVVISDRSNILSKIGKFVFFPSSVYSERTHYDSEKNKGAVTITIHSKPTDKDYKAIVERLKTLTKHLPSFKEHKNLDQDIELRDMYEAKSKYQKSGEPISNKDIAQDFYKDREKNKKVIDTVNRINKLDKKYFGSSEK